MSNTNPFGTSFSLASKVSRHHYFINLGLSALSATVAYVGLKHNIPVVGIPAAFSAMMLGITNLIGTPSVRFNTFTELGSLGLLTKVMEYNQEKFIPFKNKVLSFEQIEANKVTKQFVAAMFLVSHNHKNLYIYINKSEGYKDDWIMDFAEDTFNNNKDVLVPIYEKNFKHSFILVKALLKAAEKDKIHHITNNLFMDLFPIHNKQFSQEEIQYLEKHFDRNKIKNLSWLADEDVFKCLPFKLQEEILILAQDKIDDKEEYDKLLLIHQSHDKFEKNEVLKEEIQTQEVLIQEKLTQEVTINSNSQQKLDTFEKRFNYLYENEKQTLDSISQLLLIKEKISYVLENSDQKQLHIEAKLFLNNDVDNLIKSFNQEILILMKMKVNDHPQFDNYKEQILDSIHERVYSVKGKMLDINNQINEAMEQELISTMQVNKAVLKAKV